MKKHILLALSSLILVTSNIALAIDPLLTIFWEGGIKRFSRSELMRSAELKSITINADPAYGRKPREVKAVPASVIFRDIPKEKIASDSTMKFKCLDGFSAVLDQEKVLSHSPNAAKAWIAIEEEDKPWPALKNGPSAGPFYLVWIDPEKSHIGPEQWPFQLASFELSPSLASLYPQILPNPDLKSSHPIQKGYQAFIKNCFVCHTMNMQGSSEIGPDLNVPYNVTEYLRDDFIKKIVRNPQALRNWPQARMSSFPPDQLSDQDFGYLLQYLKHMKTRKVRMPPS